MPLQQQQAPGGMPPEGMIPPGAAPGGMMPPGGAPQQGSGPLDRLGPPPTTEAEMAADLEDRFEAVKNKKAKLDTKKITDKNSMESMKQEILGKFFQAMQDQGVDLNDPASISKFLGELEQMDPDFVALLETAFNVLAPETAPAPTSGEGLMGQFGGLQESVLRGETGEPVMPPGGDVSIGMGMDGMESMEQPVDDGMAPELPPELQL